MERTIRITGKGKISITPDQVIFSLNQTQVKKEYEEANEEAAVAKNELDDVLRSIGIDVKNLKTESFSIDAEYTSYQSNDEWKRKIVGYRYRHQMRLKLDLDHELIGEFLKELSKMKYQTDIEMNYSLKNPEDAKNTLVYKAVKDSRIKAKVLSEALGVELGEVVNIDYSWRHLDIMSRSYHTMECDGMLMASGSAKMSMEPEDIELEDSVTVIWTIE